jgi:ABC-type transport system involved in multi-copper enzyme maturation permease subunit
VFWKVFAYELKYRFGLVSTWIYLAFSLLIAYFVAILAGGVFDGVSIGAGKSGEFTYMNTPLNISIFVVSISYLFTIIFAAIFGSSAVRDFENGSYEIFFTKPVSPRTYLLGKFTGSFTASLIMVITIVIGIAIGFRMPFLAEHKIGPHMPLAYLHALIYFAIPNLFVIGVLFFSIGILTRKVINSYMAGIGVFFAYILAGTLSNDVEKISSAALLDPFGAITAGTVTRYWTSAQTNTQYLSLNGLLGWNRLIWVCIGLAIMLFAVYKFDFRSQLNSGRAKKSKQIKAITPQTEPNYFTRVHTKPYNSLQQFVYLCWYEFKNIVFNRTFLVIMSIFALFLFITATQLIGSIYGTQTHPLTSQVLAALAANFYLFGLIISTFYAGDLLWRNKGLKMNQLYDASPHHSYVSYFSKMGAIFMMQWVLLFTIMIVGMIVQVSKGHFLLEPGLYITELFFVQFSGIVPITLMLFFFGIITNNKYTGYIAMILFYAVLIALGVFQINHPLVAFNSGEIFYSEMNGYGSSIPRYLIRKAYWLLFCGVLSFIGFKFWNRGVDTDFRTKLKRIKLNGFDAGWKYATACLIAFILLGGYLFYNMNILNDYTSPRKWKKLQVQYEKTYKQRLSSLPQPRISDVSLKIDIYPSKRKMDVAGSYWLVNRSSAPIDTLAMYYDDKYVKEKLIFSKPVELKHEDNDFGIYLFALKEALAPMDSIKLDFAFEHKPTGIKDSGSGSEVMYNGTFFNNSLFPSFGYKDGYELSDNNDRKKKGLEPKLRMPAITDSTQYNNSYVSSDSDYVRYAVEISTDADQLAFAPGDLLESRTEGGRYYARYGSSVPILNFLAFVSGRYEKATASYQDKQIEIYYDKKHHYNIESMLSSAKSSLEYFSQNFMPYPHKALRIVEVPYVGFAQSFPALIPFSENVGFIAKVNPKDETAVDYPYQITSHEIGHQWWAHTVIGANVQGATLFSECFTEYSSMMVLKEKYGAERLRRYLQYVHDNYLSGRSGETKEEQALYLNENQPYLNYSKGTLVMYALQDYIGEKAVNAAIGAFCRDFAYKSNPFPLSTNTLPYLRNAAPDSLNYLITDLFETITLYDNKIISTKQSYDKQAKVYRTEITFSTDKARYDGRGNKSPIPVADYLDIAIYDAKEAKRLAGSTLRVTGGEQSISIASKEKPGKVILDPFFKLIDTNRNDNMKDAG